MNIPKHHLELPAEAEPARVFIEALVARYESQIEELKQQVRALYEQVQSLSEQLQKLVSDALSQPYCQLQTEFATESQLYVDESPTKEHNAKAWLWVAVAPMLAVFGIFANRLRNSLIALIGSIRRGS